MRAREVLFGGSTLQVKPQDRSSTDVTDLTDSVSSIISCIERESTGTAEFSPENARLMKEGILPISKEALTLLLKGEDLPQKLVESLELFAKSFSASTDPYLKNGSITDQTIWLYEYLFTAANNLDFYFTTSQFL